MRLILLLSLLCCVNAEVHARHLSNEEISTFGGCYFAPITSASCWRMRDQDGAIREFEQVGRGRKLRGVDGWEAELNGKQVKVSAPASKDYPPIVYHFSNGRLESAEIEGRNCRFGYPNPLVYEGEDICPLWPDADAEMREEMFEANPMWKGDGRLRLWFSSPNQAGAFLSLLFLTLLTLAFRFERRFMRIIAFGLALAVAALLALTGSRGAVLATVVGLVPAVIFKLKAMGKLTARRLLVAVAVVLLLAVAAMSVSYFKSARSAKGDRASDAQRIELLSAIPHMMHDAPWGWNRWSEVGRAYSRWYQPISDRRVRFNLVGDHLTTVVAGGWLGGFGYVFFCSVFIFALWTFSWRGGSSLPLALWLSLAIAASFNVIFAVRHLFVLPVLSLVLLAIDRRWFRGEFWRKPLIGGFACATIAMGVLFVMSCNLPRSFLAMHHESGRSIVNGDKSSIWVVDDSEVLGPPYTSREIRRFYQKFPSAPAIGYVRSLEDLPVKAIGRLVLAGEAAGTFLRTVKMGGLPIALPREIVFLSPPFAPSEVPVSLRAQAKVSYVIGEFAARYHADLADPPKWCAVVPGAEIYIPGWMRYCFAGIEPRTSL